MSLDGGAASLAGAHKGALQDDLLKSCFQSVMGGDVIW